MLVTAQCSSFWYCMSRHLWQSAYLLYGLPPLSPSDTVGGSCDKAVRLCGYRHWSQGRANTAWGDCYPYFAQCCCGVSQPRSEQRCWSTSPAVGRTVVLHSLTGRTWIIGYLKFSPYRANNTLHPGYKQDRQCTYKLNIAAHSRNHGCRLKTICITYSECVFVALVIHHTKRMRRIISPAVTRNQPYRVYLIFRHYIINDTIFFFLGGGGGDLLNLKCVFIYFNNELDSPGQFY